MDRVDLTEAIRRRVFQAIPLPLSNSDKALLITEQVMTLVDMLEL